MVGSLSRSLVPCVLGPLYQLGIKWGYIGVPFYSMAVVGVIAIIVSYWLREHA